MSKSEYAFIEEFAPVVYRFYKSERLAGRHPTSMDVIKNCPLPDGTQASTSIELVAVNVGIQKVEEELAGASPSSAEKMVRKAFGQEPGTVHGVVKTSQADHARRMARFAEMQAKSVNDARWARARELKAAQAAEEAQQRIDARYLVLKAASDSRRAVAADAAKREANRAASEAYRAQTFPRPGQG